MTNEMICTPRERGRERMLAKVTDLTLCQGMTKARRGTVQQKAQSVVRVRCNRGKSQWQHLARPSLDASDQLLQLLPRSPKSANP